MSIALIRIECCDSENQESPRLLTLKKFTDKPRNNDAAALLEQLHITEKAGKGEMWLRAFE